MSNAEKENQIYVWDIFIRFFHWSLLILFLIAYISEDDFLTIHSWAGYLILSLLFTRIMWGFVGTKYARFSNFIYPPKQIKQFLKDTSQLKAQRYIGHNPAGGAMVILLMASLILTTTSGLFLIGIEESQGPLAATLSDAGHFWGKLFEGVHEFFVHFTILLIAIHIAGVVVESLIHRENLVSSMINGIKRKNN